MQLQFVNFKHVTVHRKTDHFVQKVALSYLLF